MPNFESPFLNKTDIEIREWKHRHSNFAEARFTILDRNTVERRICQIGFSSEESPDYRMLWSDPYADLYLRVPVEREEGKASLGLA